jgi:hypothetical protein
MVSRIFDLLIITGCIMRMIKIFLQPEFLPEPDFTPDRINYFCNDATQVCISLAGPCAVHPPDLKR